MAAYAAVLSLIHAVRRSQIATSHAKFYRDQVDHIGEMGFLLHHFLKSYSDHGEDNQRHLELERNIADIAPKAEDIIDNLVMEETVFWWSRDCLSYFESLLRVQEDMKILIEKDLEIQVRSRVQPRWLPSYQKLRQHSLPDACKRPIVGLEMEQNYILESLTRGQSSLQVLPIIGVSGTGKNTLARSIYESDNVLHEFDIRIWITMLRECTVRDLLLQIPLCKHLQDHTSSLLTASHLGEILHKYLFDKRYLIVLDDISWEIWNDIRIFFPDC
ncbi:putative disease resistance RPP13-like protein 2 [Andrographis paniculata]|uniref:putative disease resistance RPP13-like protein 2 n=1 Tax=Andrographis paniculata TaxID=175694 RepID=UPI0021E77412|nr:putative disease resistance RPP13-like protein 2 [Andrographis paniculata]